MHVIAFTNQKGGVGKTTSAVNIAAQLAASGKRVIIIDLDPQGNATSGLGINKEKLRYSSYDALLKPEHADKLLITTPFSDLQIMPATQDLAAAEIELASVQQREQRLKQVVGNLKADYIIIDSPPSLGLLTINALTAATQVIVPVQAEFYALEGLGQLLQTFKKIKKLVNPNLNLLGVIVTMYDSRTTLSAQVKQQLDKHFSDVIFETIVPRNIRLAESPSHGKPISHHDKWSKGARAYKALAKEVVKRLK